MRPRVNEAIRVPSVHLIDENGNSFGVVSRDQALVLAYEKGVDLVEVAPQLNPPVVKLTDYGKYLYSLQKKEQRAKTHQKESQLKEVRLGFKIDEHDRMTKLKRAGEFLAAGHKVRVAMLLRGRERAYVPAAIEKVKEFIAATGGKLEAPPKQLGRTITAVVTR